MADGPVERRVLLERESGERDDAGDDLLAGLVELARAAEGEHAAQLPAGAERLQGERSRRR